MKCKYKTHSMIILITVIGFTMSAAYGQSITFIRSGQTFPGAMTYQVALGDLDNDGDLDAVCANMGFNNSRIWRNNGKGQFTSGQALTQQGHGVALNDLDNDGDLDVLIVCAEYGSKNKQSKIYFNDGTGQLIDSGQNLGDSLLSANHIDLMDIDTDGDQDAQILYYDDKTQSTYYKFFLNNGSGIFAESSLTFTPNQGLTWGDLDADGDMDIFIKMDKQGYRVMLNKGGLSFSTCWELADASATSEHKSVVLEDFDGDGDLDAFLVNRLSGQSLPAKVFFNDGTGQFTDSGQNLGSFNGFYWLSSGDLDKDGDKDIFISAFQKPNQVWINDGSGLFTDSGLRLGGNAAHRGTALGDLDGDNDIDAFVANFGSGSNEVWFNDTITSINDKGSSIQEFPKQFQLFQNYPNPFNSSTCIQYRINRSHFVNLKVYDVLGKEIKTLVNEEKPGGEYQAFFTDIGLASGIYFYRLQVDDDACQIKRMCLMK